ncbi:hypothetical protein Fcan01_28451 [Folsomia candida]|uniref:Uncharacterized protein n=1 Tax=Folsomia candida TaxID=158441 RepID=A0A226CVJ6_FOLCA|nr:hypothetical protein Fcan01_28451 [Folsomia candida]
MADDAAAAAAATKLNQMTTDFKDKADGMLGEMGTQFNSVVEAVLKNFGTLQASYLKGYEDIFKQVKKANDDMLKNMEDNMKNLKTSVQSNYDAMNVTLKEGYAKAMAEFGTQTQEMMKKNLALLSPSVVQETVAALNAHQKEVLDMNAKRFKGIMENLDKQKFKALVEEVTIPGMAMLPKLVQPVLKSVPGSSSSPPTSTNNKK